jgi:hypothetical protein
MEMRLRPFLSSVLLLALAANQPSFAKEAHGQHGSRAGVANNANAKSANPAATKANSAIDGENTVPPPVLPPQAVTKQRNRTINPSVKIITPGNTAHGQAGGTTAPAARNAIGQPIVQSKALAGAQPQTRPTLQAPGKVPPPPFRSAAPAAPPVVSSNTVHANAPAVNVANAANRGSINGAGLTRPAAAPGGIGGAARPNYGINGTAVQNKH